MKQGILVLAALLTACGGGSGGSAPTNTQSPASVSSTTSSSVASSAAPVIRDPIKVKSNSYENKMLAGNPSNGLSPVVSEGGVSHAYAYADFFQDGSLSMVVASAGWVDPDKIFPLYFFKKDAKGKWVDHTSALLKDTAGCVWPRKAIVSDFNNDGKPDVFFACTGFDYVDKAPGEEQRLLLSKSDNTYENILLPITCYCHGASAGDLTGDGIADIVVTDTTVGSMPYVLVNDGRGNFTKDTARLPIDMKGKAIYSVELIDAGRNILDLFVGGVPLGSDPGVTEGDWYYPTGVLRNNGDGTFLEIEPFDNPPGKTGIVYSLGLDFIVDGDFVYTLRVNNHWGDSAHYDNMIIQRTDLANMQTENLYEHIGKDSSNMGWVPWITADASGDIVPVCLYISTDVTDNICRFRLDI